MLEDFSYTPVTAEQADASRFQVIEPGVYGASIELYEGRVSSSGNRMVVFTVRVYDKQNNHHDIKDFIVLTGSMDWKLRKHCEAVGLINEYDAGKWHPRMSVGKNLNVEVGIDKGREIPHDKLNGKAPGTCYPDRNKIENYVKGEDSKGSTSNVQHDSFESDDIPF